MLGLTCNSTFGHFCEHFWPICLRQENVTFLSRTGNGYVTGEYTGNVHRNGKTAYVTRGDAYNSGCHYPRAAGSTRGGTLRRVNTGEFRAVTHTVTVHVTELLVSLRSRYRCVTKT